MKARICLATDSGEPSGVGEHMLALGGVWRDAYDVVVACPASPGGRTLLRRAMALGLGIKQLEEDEAGVSRWLSAKAFDLLHIHAGIGWEGHGLAVIGRSVGLRAIVRTEHLPNVITDPAQRRAHAQGLGLVDRVICVSRAAADTFCAAGAAADKLAIIRNGLSPRPPQRSRTVVREVLGVEIGAPVLLTAARFTPQKGHAILLAALAPLLARWPNLQLWLAGAGPLEADLRAWAEALGVASAVRFLGFRDDLPDLFAAADLFVLPSHFEGLPLVVIEAMAAGLPVVATDVGGTNEVVSHEGSGRLVAPNDAGDLARAIGGLLSDRRAAAALGAAGRARYESTFTAARMAAETAELYRGLGVSPGPDHRNDMMQDTTARTRVGFIGAGGIAHRHLGVLEQFDDVEIAAFADPAEERAREAAERFGARAYADYATMLAEQPLDALYICVPPFAHGEPERAALAKHLPFFVEKPVALDLSIAEEVARAVTAAGLVTGVGYHWRYLDTVDEARAILADNPAQLVSGYWLDSTPPPQWWWKQDRSGGQMNEQTTHIVDLARYLVGEVTQVFGLAGHKPRDEFPGLDVATVSTASLKFASGAVANIGSTCLLRWNHRVGLHVFADGLAMEVTDHDLMVDVGRGRPVRHAEGDPVWREDRDFIDAVRGGENRIRCSYAEALATLRVTAAIQRSIETGQAASLTPQAAGAVHV